MGETSQPIHRHRLLWLSSACASLHPHRWPRWLRWLGIPVLVASVAGIILLLWLYFHFSAEANRYEISELETLGQGTRVVDAQGRLAGTLFAGDHKYMKLEKVPHHLIDAVLATEDDRFYSHSGSDLRAVARAAIANFGSRSVRQGASTITQQLTRQAFNLRGRTYSRKLLEMVLAWRIEDSFSKDQILEYYLNEIYLGSGFRGVGAAARGYFGKEVGSLTVEESALLAAIIKAPVTYSPYRAPDLALASRNRTLERMAITNRLPADQAAALKSTPLVVQPENRRSDRPEYLIAALEREFHSAAAVGDYHEVTVSVDVDLQKRCSDLLLQHLRRVEDRFGGGDPAQPLQGAVLVVENETGLIRAVVGGRDYRSSPFDRAIQGQRPAGTAFLPLAYAAIFAVRPELISAWVLDAPLDNRRAMVGGVEGTLGEWGTEVEPRAFLGHLSAPHALLRGRNGAAIRLAYNAGLDAVRLQLQPSFSTPLREHAPFIVGGSAVRLLDFARACSSLARNGELPPPARLAVSAKTHNRRTVAFASRLSGGTAFPVHAAAAVRAVMIANLRQPEYRPELEQASLADANLAGYGGTAYNFTDAWFIGFDQKLTCLVWMGYDQSKSIGQSAWARETVYPLWCEVMGVATRGARNGWPANDSSLCVLSGVMAEPACWSAASWAVVPFPIRADILSPFCGVHRKSDAQPAPPPGIAEVILPSQKNPRAIQKAVPVVPAVRPAQSIIAGYDPMGFGTAAKAEPTTPDPGDSALEVRPARVVPKREKPKPAKPSAEATSPE